jgi:hypothetical protein
LSNIALAVYAVPGLSSAEDERRPIARANANAAATNVRRFDFVKLGDAGKSVDI